MTDESKDTYKFTNKNAKIEPTSVLRFRRGETDEAFYKRMLDSNGWVNVKDIPTHKVDGPDGLIALHAGPVGECEIAPCNKGGGSQ
jgi:hypothetical protein